MKKTAPILIALLALLISSVVGQESPSTDASLAPEKAGAVKKLFDVMKMKETMSATMSAGLDPQLQQMAQLGISEAGLAKMKEEMIAFLEEVMSWDAIEGELIQLYAETFSVDELNAISEFYATPAGQKMIENTPELTGKSMMLAQERVQANMGKLQARLLPIIQEEQAKQQ